MTTPSKTRAVRVGDLVFDVSVAGEAEGAPVALLLHGFPQSSASWDLVARQLADAGVATFAPDQRGYSPGARPGDVDDYRLDALVRDVVGLCDALELNRVHLVGHDWGAIVAWAVAARHPDLVASLTALSVPHPAAFAWAIRRDPEQREKSGYMEFFQQTGPAEELLLADNAAGLRIGFGDAVPAGLADRHIRLLGEPGAMTAALNWYRAKGDDWAAVPPVGVPATFLWGSGDIAVMRSGVDRCGEFVTGEYEFVELDGVGHWLPEEVPGEVATAVLARVHGGAREG
ncbi:alpha/beta fold hydrolase [Rhodococcus sp. RD6.2]|uniref:alpha/beta fold hydrolase n=1 Tax=Rhodococcus sp. RD6.2 TaxID=260936 RepID=UPI0006789D96|nr:alpha/beta hydrolase [Rhodococcus sp. RD6.2]